MPVTINGTTGISTPGQANTGNETISGTLAVTGATTVGGVSVVAVAPGTSGNVMTSNGTAWTSAAASGGGQIQYAVYTASGTWTAPTGVTKALVWCVGAGAGGVVNTYGGCGPYNWYGGAGGYAIALVTVVPGTGYTITIGTAGAGTVGSSSGTITGIGGGTTSFGSLVTATGGAGSGINGAGAVTYGANGAGSTTGTMIRNGAQSNAVNNPLSNGAQVLSIFAGYQSVGPSGSSAATVWAISSIYGPGVCGNVSGANAYGGVNGAILIQYVG